MFALIREFKIRVRIFKPTHTCKWHITYIWQCREFVYCTVISAMIREFQSLVRSFKATCICQCIRQYHECIVRQNTSESDFCEKKLRREIKVFYSIWIKSLLHFYQMFNTIEKISNSPQHLSTFLLMLTVQVKVKWKSRSFICMLIQTNTARDYKQRTSENDNLWPTVMF